MFPMAKKKRERGNVCKVEIPNNHPNPPEQHEINVAMILSRHYQTTVEFIVPIDDYKRKSADIVMHGVDWEIKCPIGTSKSTISGQFQRASKQSKNIIIDSRRTKLKFPEIEKRVLNEVKKRTSINRVILIDKNEKVIEIQK
jgi:predicted phage-related endonuclease